MVLLYVALYVRAVGYLLSTKTYKQHFTNVVAQLFFWVKFLLHTGLGITGDEDKGRKQYR